MRAFSALALLALAAAACAGSPDAPTAPTDSRSGTLASEPPPPPIEGVVLYAGTGDGDRSDGFSTAGGDRLRVAGTGIGSVECTLPTFCVPGRYLLNNTNNNEWLDFVTEDPLPADIRRQLKQFGAACLVGDASTDASVDQDGTLFCPVGSMAQGRIINRDGVTEGVGLAYDVSAGGLTVTTVALDQFDVFAGKGLICRSVEGSAFCTTPPVFGDVWVGSDEDEDGVITYVRGPRVYSPFTFVGGSLKPPPVEVVP